MTPLGNRVLIAALAVGALGTGLAVAGSSTPAPARAQAVSSVAGTITIDPRAGETFAQAPAGAAPALTAQQAWAMYTRETGHGDTAMPSTVAVHLGLLTLPAGPVGPGGSEAYTARNELVYGYSGHSCPASKNPRVHKLPPNPCIEWDFVDARTGHLVDQTWQM
jgi:hypothetical protein